jgi:outer membrane protein assembly factor BamB
VPNSASLKFSVLATVFTSLTSLCIAEDWPQWRGPQRDGVWHAEGLVTELPEGQLPLEWSTEIGPGYSGPTVADGRVYVMDRNDTDERVLCLDSVTGKQVWVHTYPAEYTVSYKAGPRASVTVASGRAYAVGSMGHFHCLDAATGKVIWQHDLSTEYKIEMPIWGIAASPLVYENSVILQVSGADGACMVAFSQSDGKEVWRSLNERAGYSSPVVIQQAGQDVLVCWTGESLSGLDPRNGNVHWAHPMLPRNMPIGIATPCVDSERVFVSSFYDGSLMIRTPKDQLTSSVIWRAIGKDEQNTAALHTMIGTPILDDAHIYGVDSYGEFRCLNAETGARIWEDLTAVPKARWSTIHMVRQANTDTVWMFNERGELLMAKLSPSGLKISDRCQLIEPTKAQLPQRGGVCWSHPAFAEKSIFIRNDNRIVRASLAKSTKQ